VAEQQQTALIALHPVWEAMLEAICCNLHLAEHAYKIDKMQRWRKCRMHRRIQHQEYHSNSLMVLIIVVSLLMNSMSFSMPACRQANFVFPIKQHVNSSELSQVWQKTHVFEAVP
jgi:hypothetical protein